MKHITITIFFIFLSTVSFSQMSRYDYISKYQLLAIKEMKRSGIPASITMAQACLESADGNSELSRKSNNHFGIKCKKGWNGGKVYYDDDAKDECFRKYKNVEDSYIDHTNFLMDNPRYAFLFSFEATDYKNWARGLKKAGYATAKTYDKRLIEIIEKNKLFRLDYKISFEEISVFEQKKIGNEGISNTLTINPYEAHRIIKRNRVKSVVAQRGDTYQILAQELGLKDWEIFKFNDQVQGYIPQPNEVVYVKAKKRKTKKDKVSHLVQEGETMHYISQMYGIRLRPLYTRNKMKPGTQPAIGQTVFLRKPKKVRK